MKVKGGRNKVSRNYLLHSVKRIKNVTAVFKSILFDEIICLSLEFASVATNCKANGPF